MYAPAAPHACDVIEDLSTRGRYHFTSAEARSALGVSAAAARQALSRLAAKGAIASPACGVYHRTAGVPKARLSAGRAVRPRPHGTPQGSVLRSATVRRTIPRRCASSSTGVPGHAGQEQARDFVRRRRVTFAYRYLSESVPPMRLRLKVEINTHDHFAVYGFAGRPFSVESRWCSGTAIINTFELDELLATKLGALYQRTRGPRPVRPRNGAR